jgi:hypothetical protein
MSGLNKLSWLTSLVAGLIFQIVWPVVALATLFKVLMNARIVGLTVAVVATQNHFVGATVAEYTLNLGMFGGVARKLLKLAPVATATQLRSDSRFGKL